MAQQMETRMQCNHRERDWSEVVTSRRMPTTTRLSKRQKNRSSLRPPEKRNSACWKIWLLEDPAPKAKAPRRNGKWNDQFVGLECIQEVYATEQMPNCLPGHRGPRALCLALIPVTTAEWTQGSWSTQ
eukprot:XP_028353544.1 uncharacterized protein LOC114487490 isoform X5 [Physeter catodon]